MFRWLFCLSFFVSVAFAETIDQLTSADQVTEEWLIRQGNLSGYSDHISHFKEIFSQTKVRTFLEFGLGLSTKYFLDNSRKVISVEFITHGYGPEYYKKCVQFFNQAYNWIPIAFFSGYKGDTDWAPYKYLGSEAVYKAAAYQCGTHKNYALIDDFYLIELDAFVKNLQKYHQIDIAFVDPGIYLRGDLVQILFGKVPIIVAHDTYCRALGDKDDVYGYSRIVTPDHYEEIFLPYGVGTTVWVSLNGHYQELINNLKKYAQGFQP
ncbi:MAG TPA: hypothetical protein PKW79_03660 [Rhabdochlamydiaceae bacterium]|nr:hypothetical protein [Rhabdochlamydiaceae bacterium]